MDLTQGTITFRADTSVTGGVSNGSFAAGVTLWTGFGEDTILIDGTHQRADLRTITTLNTGLGDDLVYVDLDASEANGTDTRDGVFVLNTQGAWNDYPSISDNDTVLGTGTISLDVGIRTPILVDLDDDGDLDMVAGAVDGTLRYYRNTGTAAAPVYVEADRNCQPVCRYRCRHQERTGVCRSGQ